ncbi:MAG: CerR family C-terminal domain-containing protein [Planctomycetota bacterium]|jgi:hypothetical protein
MSRRSAAAAWAALDPPPTARADAAAALARFIHLFLASLLHPPRSDGDVASRLIMREATQPSEAIDFVVRDFIEPHESMLIRIMQVLVPGADRAELAMLSHSVLGQVLHYRAHRPLLERIAIRQWLDAAGIRQIAEHIARFSLRAIDCPQKIIDEAVRQIADEPGDPAIAAREVRR